MSQLNCSGRCVLGQKPCWDFPFAILPQYSAPGKLCLEAKIQIISIDIRREKANYAGKWQKRKKF